MFFEVFGGLGLFLFGMHIMSDGLQKLAGARMRLILEKITSNRFIAVLVGAIITAIIQSSSATTVMTVGLVNAGLLSFVQALGVVIGANIGTTITAQIIAFKLTEIALPAIGIGVFMRMLAKREQVKSWGDFLTGFGLIFFGMMVMKNGVGPMKDALWISDLFIKFADNPLLGVGVGALVTMMLQSSSATVALTIALTASGVIDFVAAAALVLGENIGTTITAQLAAIGTNVNAKRVAVSHLVFNVFGVGIILLIFPWYIDFVQLVTGAFLSPGETASEARLIANFHTLFNVTNCLIFLPLLGLLEKAALVLVPGESAPRRFRLESLDQGIFASVPLAVEEARGEVHLMADEVYGMLDVAEDAIVNNHDTRQLYEELKGVESFVDDLQKEINTFLTELSRQSTTEDQSKEIFSLLYMTSNLEKIGDHCESLAKLSNRRYEYGLEFSSSARNDLEQIYSHTIEYLRIIIEAMRYTPGALMEKVGGFETRLNAMRKEMRINHMERLQASQCSADAGLVFIDMISSFEKIGDHAYNIAETLSGVK